MGYESLIFMICNLLEDGSILKKGMHKKALLSTPFDIPRESFIAFDYETYLLSYIQSQFSFYWNVFILKFIFFCYKCKSCSLQKN